MNCYHPAIHVAPPLSARYRTAPRIRYQEAVENGDMPVDDVFDGGDSDVPPVDTFDDDWDFMQTD